MAKRDPMVQFKVTFDIQGTPSLDDIQELVEQAMIDLVDADDLNQLATVTVTIGDASPELSR